MIFQSRLEAGRQLAAKLVNDFLGKKYAGSLLVLAIPRGGVIIGKELATTLNCPLDVVITKKIGAPENSELAIGAVGAFGEPTINEELAEKTGASEEYLKLKIKNLKLKIAEQEKIFRSGKRPLNLKDKIVILTDDGVATGATMAAAVEIVRQQNPKKIIVAVPVVARDSLAKIEAMADEVVYLDAPEMFFAVGQFYKDFPQIADAEVLELLQ